MRELIQKDFACEVKTIGDDRTVDVVMSDASVDRLGEIVALDWQFDTYVRTNPVVLYAHDASELPIGRCENVRVEGGALRGTIRFASEKANPLAERCFQLFKEKVLNSVSVGFIAHARRWDTINGAETLILEKNELVELSVTPTPCNRAAVATRRALARAEHNAATHSIEPLAQEKKMDEVESKMLALNDEHTKALEIERTKLADSEKAHEATRTELKALQDAFAAMKTERDTAQMNEKALTAKLASAVDTLTVRDVEDLVGKKIVPAQRDAMLALARSDRKSFDAIVASSPALNLLDPIVPAAKSEPSSIGSSASEELAARLAKG